MALNMDKLRKKSEDLARGSYGSADYDKLQPGKNVRRVLPPKGDKDVFWSEGFIHFGLGDDGNKTATCLETFGEGKKCPICKYADKLKASKSQADRKLAERIRRTKRMYIAVINRDGDEEKPLVLPVGKTILQPIIDIICDPDYGDITDLHEGRDITITKTGKGLNTEYSVIAKPNQTEALTELDEKELEGMMPDLDALFVKRSVDDLQAILDGEEPGQGDDDDEGEGDEPNDTLAYDDMELDDLAALCEERGIDIPARMTKLKLITLLERYDEVNGDGDDDPPAPARKTGKATKPSHQDDDGDGEGDEDGEGDSDDLQDAISRAVNTRRGRR